MTRNITDIYVLNRSTLVSAKQALLATLAVNRQVAEHFAPIWYIDSRILFADLHHVVPPDNRVIVIVDNAKDWDGMHTLSQSGKPYGIVAVQPELDAGTQWTVALSHEVLEMLVDSFVMLSALRGRRLYSAEVCDPCEADQFGYEIGGVLVSDFITPAWFDQDAAGPYSFRENCTHPFHILPGGYMESRYFAKVPEGALRTSTGGTMNKRPIGSRRQRRLTPA